MTDLNSYKSESVNLGIFVIALDETLFECRKDWCKSVLRLMFRCCRFLQSLEKSSFEKLPSQMSFHSAETHPKDLRDHENDGVRSNRSFGWASVEGNGI